ncbi:MAG: helix-turn-helix transcriptional regulator [Spirochaetota bacterium]
MLVVEKTRHIEVEIKGKGADAVLDILKKELPELVVSDDDEYESIRESAWFDNLRESVTPGMSLKVYRDNAGLTQAELSKKTGIPVPHISAMENDKRPVGKGSAIRLATALGCDYRRFL